MKRCPECYEVYDNSEKFCELDGRRLLFDPALSPEVVENVPERIDGSNSKSQYLATGLIGLMVGIILCLGAYAVWILQSDSEKADTPARTSQIQERVPARPAPAQIPQPQPTATGSANAEAEASPELPSENSTVAESQTVAAHLNQGPVSTGRSAVDSNTAGTQTFIEMTDGSTLEVDAAWEDTQGIWYRRSGLVTFLESRRVKAISARSEPKSSSASSK